MWFAVYTRSRFEKKIEQDLLDKGVDVFLPTIKKLRKWKDRKKWVTLPLFANYIFVNIDYKDRLNTLQTDGVVRILTFLGKPIPIHDKKIEMLKIANKTPEKVKIYKPENNIVGKTVIIKSGPFEGIQGVVVESKNDTRVIVTIERINQSFSVSVEQSDLEIE